MTAYGINATIPTMRRETIEAFQVSDQTARLLGDMKHGVAEVRYAEADEREKLAALKRFQLEARKILENMGGSIDRAFGILDEERIIAQPLGANTFCLKCGSHLPAHAPFCEEAPLVGAKPDAVKSIIPCGICGMEDIHQPGCTGGSAA